MGCLTPTHPPPQVSPSPLHIYIIIFYATIFLTTPPPPPIQKQFKQKYDATQGMTIVVISMIMVVVDKWFSVTPPPPQKNSMCVCVWEVGGGQELMNYERTNEQTNEKIRRNKYMLIVVIIQFLWFWGGRSWRMRKTRKGWWKGGSRTFGVGGCCGVDWRWKKNW